MKVFIVSDMEGVAGIVKWQQVMGGHAMYDEGRKLYTGEINAAVRGAKAAGATELDGMDCQRAAAARAEGAGADRGRRAPGARRCDGGRAVRPRLALRDHRGLQHVGPRREIPVPPRRDGHRTSADRVAGRRLVDGLAAVLLL